MAQLWLCLALLAGLGARAGAEDLPRVIRVGLELNAEPFTFVDASGKPAGFAYDLLQAVAADQNLEIEYLALPWNDVLDGFKAVFPLLPDLPALLTEWEALVTTHACVGKLAHDARLVAAMRTHGVTDLLTFNGGDFRRFPGITIVDPAAP